MSEIRDKRLKAQRRMLRTRSRLMRGSRMRVAVFRSHQHIYAQLIDDGMHKTVASASSLAIKNASGTKSEIARNVGRELARKAQEIGVESVIFDRGSFLYHGRVKEVAEGLREGGLNV